MKRAAGPKGKSRIGAILVTGTPCCGKTTLAKRLARSMGWGYIDGNKLARAHASSYDRKRRCYILDEDVFVKAATKHIQEAHGKAVLDSHLAHLVPPKMARACIVVRCPLKTLHRRLVRRGYHKSKVDENMECEIMDVCLEEARETGHRVIEVQGVSPMKIPRIIEMVGNKKGRTRKKRRRDKTTP